MALSLNTIHKPLNDFFLQRFGMGTTSPVVFRFDKVGSVISDADYLNPADPSRGYSPELARERFSDLVNQMPSEVGDGVNVVLSAENIDEAYFFRLLKPSLPYVTDTTDPAVAQSVVESFSALKARAEAVYEAATLASLSGLMLDFKASDAVPGDWYDRTNDRIWTSHKLQVTETTTTPAPPVNSKLWKLKLDDQGMRTVLQPTVPVPPRPVPPSVRIRDHRTGADDPPPRRVVDHRTQATAVNAQAVRVSADALRRAPTAPARPIVGLGGRNLHDAYVRQARMMAIRDRIRALRELDAALPKQVATTNSIVIEFEYTVVKIERPWLVPTFLNDTSWYVPGCAKGQLSGGAAGSGLTLLPVAFVAVRNLSIAATWTSEDIAAADRAIEFGPFSVQPKIVAGKLTHPGLQIVGWLLQRLPVLPPNGDPALHPVAGPPATPPAD
jgi:hypothetical protein